MDKLAILRNYLVVRQQVLSQIIFKIRLTIYTYIPSNLAKILKSKDFLLIQNLK